MRLSLIQFVRTKFQVAKENPLFWANLALLALTVGFIWLWPSPITEAGPSDFRLRAWAATLQLTGAGIVFWDLTTFARKHDRPGLLNNTIAWAKRLVSRHHIASGALVGLGGSFVQAQGGVLKPQPLPGTTLEDRVSALENSVKQLDEGLSNAIKQIGEVETAIKRQIAEESRKREASHKELSESIKDAIIGNYATLSFGAFWAIVGMLVSAFSQDIARLGAGQWQTVWAYM